MISANVESLYSRIITPGPDALRAGLIRKIIQPRLVESARNILTSKPIPKCRKNL